MTIQMPENWIQDRATGFTHRIPQVDPSWQHSKLLKLTDFILYQKMYSQIEGLPLFTNDRDVMVYLPYQVLFAYDISDDDKLVANMSRAVNLLLMNAAGKYSVESLIDGEQFIGQPMRTREVSLTEGSEARKAIIFGRIRGTDRDSNAFEYEYIQMQFKLRQLFEQNARWGN